MQDYLGDKEDEVGVQAADPMKRMVFMMMEEMKEMKMVVFRKLEEEKRMVFMSIEEMKEMKLLVFRKLEEVQLRLSRGAGAESGSRLAGLTGNPY